MSSAQANAVRATAAPETAEPMVDVRKVRKVYRRDAEELTVLDGIDLQVPAGEFVALMGPSGSGKTTLLNLIAGIDRPTSGQVIVAGTDVARLSESELAKWRSRSVGFIFQFYNLIPVLRAVENVELPLLLTRLSKKERRERALTALKVVGLADRSGHYPRQLSGGQEQRVAIARAIVGDPSVLVADEPTGDLDAKSAEDILALMETPQPRVPQDDRHGDPRPARGRARARPAPPREGRAEGGLRAMKFLPFVLKHLRRNWVRTLATVLAMAVCIFLFCTLQTFLAAIDGAAGSSERHPAGHPPRGEPRLQRAAVLRPAHRGSAGREARGHHVLVRRLPARQEGGQGGRGARRRGTDWSKFFPNMAVDADPYFAMHPEFEIPPDQYKRFQGGPRRARSSDVSWRSKFGWKVGDASSSRASSRPTARRAGPSSSRCARIFDADLVREPAADTA